MTKDVLNYSVLMSVYYKEKAEYFLKAIDSMLKQTIPPNDFVIVCDGPLTDELEEIIKEVDFKNPSLFQIVRLKKNMGLANALNEGIEYCKNEIVARMDSDDISVKERMEWQLAMFSKDAEIAVVGGQIAEFENTPEDILNYRIVPCNENEIVERVKKRNPLNHMTVTFKKSAVVNVGKYPNITFFEDYALWATLIAKGCRIVNVPQICCYMRAGDGMYARRGGKEYLNGIRRIETLLLNNRLISRLQYIKNVTTRSLGAVVLTPKLRKILYSSLLRKKNYESNNKNGKKK